MYKKLILQKQGQFENHLLFFDVLSGPQKDQLYYQIMATQLQYSCLENPMDGGAW